MFGLGMGEILIIAVIALLALGPDKLPDAARAIGKGIRDLRRQTRDLQDTLEKDTQLGDAVRELKSALRDEPSRVHRPPKPFGVPRGEPLGEIAKETAPAAAETSPADGAREDSPAGTGGSGPEPAPLAPPTERDGSSHG